ncbi:MAG TPA: SdrD B-like domain-containing protein [Acetobacteraceae bacterium]|jgi:uncharacterized repeat protein (TIGR01451 family)
MPTPFTYTTSWTFDNLTGGDLSFTDIVSNEQDYGSYQSFTDGAGDPFWLAGLGNLQGMEWSGVRSSALGTHSETQFQISYNVNVTAPGEAITSIEQAYLVDEFLGKGSGNAVEQAYDSSGDLVGTSTLSWNGVGMQMNQVNLAAGYQQLSVVVTVTETTGPGGTGGAIASTSAFYQEFGLTSLSNLAVIGDNVFLDNADTGVQSGVNAGPGVPGVTVNLLEDISGTYTQVASTTTDTNGLYQFIAQPGTYEVQFVKPTGYSLSPQGPMGNDLDSTPNQTNGLTPSFVVTQGETIGYVDAGLVPPNSQQNGTASIGDNVWLDSADTGIQSGVNAGPGVAGVTVDLLQETSGVFTQVATTSTDSNGLYSFDSLNAGTYEVQFVSPNGYFFSPQNADNGGFDDLNSTANTATGITQAITLATGQAITSVDAGLVQADASITLEKLVSVDGGASWVAAPTTSGEPIMLNDNPAGSPEYEFVVTNNGNVALSSVTLADSPLNIGALGNLGSLAVGASDTVVATGTWAAGQNTDIATTTGTYIGSGITSTPTATATGNYFGAAPGVSVQKFVSVDGGNTWVSAPTTAGEPTELAGGPAPEFEFVVTNTGNVAENVVVYDAPHINSNSLGAVGTIASLAVGASNTIVGIGTWAGGQQSDVATAVGSYTDSSNFLTTTTAVATANYFGDQPFLTLQKYVSVDGGATWEATPTGGLDPTMLNDNPHVSPEFEFIVTNLGNVALTNVTLTDAALAGGAVNLGAAGNIGSLAAGASTTIVATGTWAAGQNTDLATATGTVIANGITATPSMTAVGNYFGAAPGVSIQKFVSVDGGNTWVSAPTAAGEPSLLANGAAPEFEFVVTNTGNVVENVVVDDAPLLHGQVGTVSNMAIGATATLFATGTFAVGQNQDTATAVGSYTDTTGFFTTTTATATGNYFGDQPAIGVQKLESLDGGATWITQTAPSGEPTDLAGGPAPEFEFIVTNLGNVALNNVTLSDAAVAGSAVNLGALGNIGSLGVGASTTVTATGTWAAGQNTDLATATGTVVVNGITATPSAIATENYFGGSPSIGVQKFVSVNGGATWVAAPTSSGEPTELAGGPAPEFEFVVTNTGNVVLHNVVLSDSPLSLGAAGSIGTLATGASTTIVATGTWAAGQNADIASVTGTVIANGVTSTPSATATANYFGDSPAITLVKYVSVNNGSSWVLAPTTSGEPTDIAGGPAPEYEFVVTNSGNVALNNVSLTDAVVSGGAINLGALGNIGSLAVGATDTIVATGTWAAGQNTDNASVVGTVIANGITSTPSATASANYFGYSPSITLVKYVSVNGGANWVLAPTTSGEPTELAGGPAPEYEFVVTNSGSVALTNVSLTDTVVSGGAINLGSLGSIGSLAAGASDTIVATGTWAAGQNTDNANVTGTVIANGITSTPSATATANYFGDSPAITLVKYVSVNGGSSWVLAPTTSGQPTELAGGPAPEYEFVVTNSGNVALTNVSLTDTVALGGAINLGALGSIGSLAVGASDTIVATGTWAAGQNTDNAKVAGTVIANGITATPTATATANYFGDSPAITLVKYVSVNGGSGWVLAPTTSGEPTELAGGPAPEYEFVVTNSGNVALTSVSLTDTVALGGAINLGTLGTIGSLAVGATDTIVATGTWAAGQNTDNAKVTGTVIANGITATPTATATANYFGDSPSITLVKYVSVNGGTSWVLSPTTSGEPTEASTGPAPEYEFVVTNNGNVALTNVSLTDTIVAGGSINLGSLGNIGNLAVGATDTIVATGTWASGQNTDDANVVGTVIANGITATPSASAAANWLGTTPPTPGVSIVKTVTSVGGVAGDGPATYVGEVIDYKVVVTNTGNEALTNVNVGDTTLGTTLGTVSSLAIGQSVTYTASQAVSQADLNQILGTSGGCAGSVTHTGPGSGAGSGCTAWFSSSFNPASCANGATYTFKGITCTISGSGTGGSTFTEKCPDATITFSSSCKTPTTVFNASTNCWVTTLPANCSPGSIFLSGLPVTVPSGCNFNNSTITWSIGQSINNCGATNISWDSSCGGFDNFNQNGCNGLSNYNQIGVQSCDNIGGITSGWGYNSTTTCAGTPQNQYNGNNCNSGSYTQGYGDNSNSCDGNGSCVSTAGTPTNVSGSDIINTATVTDTQGATGSSTASTVVVAAAPSIGLQKYVSVDGGHTWVLAPTTSGQPTEVSSGPAPEYEFVVTNTGNIALTNVSLSDTAVSGGAVNLGTLGNIGSLAIGASDTIVATGTWAAGQNTDDATVTGTMIANGITATPSATAAANYLGAAPSIGLQKLVSVNGGATWVAAPTTSGEPTKLSGGLAPEYEFIVTNLGNVALSSVSLSDTVSSGGAVNLGTLGNIGSLGVGASDTIVATGTWAAGQNTDTATVTGSYTDTGGHTGSTSASSTANYLGTTPSTSSGLTVIKVPSQMTVSTSGQVSYTFDVTNSGGTALTNVQISDNIGTAANPDYITPVLQTNTTNGVLLPGQTWVYTATINESGDYTSKGGSQSCSIGGSNVGSGCTAWLNSSFTPTSTKDGATYNFKGISCTIKGPDCGTFTVQVPDACITFSSSCTSPTTTYNASENCWVTTLPANCNPGNVFLSGLPYGIPSGTNLSGANCTWSIGTSANNCGSSNVQWQTGCTGYSSFNQNGCNGQTDYNQIGVKSCDNSSAYGNGGDCNQGYGYNYGDSNGYCGGSYGGYGGYGGGWWGSGSNWNGSSNDCAGTPENQYCGSNSGSGNNGCGSSNSGTCGNGSGSGTVACGQLGDSSEADTVTVTATTLGRGFSLGDAANYGIIAFDASTFKGASNSPINGSVGLGLASNCSTTTVQLNSAKITGNLVATGNKPSSIGGTVTGTTSGNNSTLAADITALATLSQTLAAETGTTEKLTSGMTINATSGTLDSAGDEVFTITQWSNNITINGNGSNNVVLNVASGVNVNLDNVTLTGGLTANEVLFNDQNASTITGTSGDTFNGTFLAPNATFSVTGVTVDGHLFGGANGQTFGLTSGATLNTPANTATGTPTITTATASDSTEVQVLASNSPITVGGTAPTGSLSSLYGTAEKLEFTYNPSNTVSTKQIGIGVETGSNGNSMAFIEISNSSNAFASNATIYFEGEVETGEKIYADATTNQLTNTPIAAPNNHFSTVSGADVYAYVFSSQAAFAAGSAPVQTIAYNASGSAAMHLGDQIGSLALVGYVGGTGGHLVS